MSPPRSGLWNIRVGALPATLCNSSTTVLLYIVPGLHTKRRDGNGADYFLEMSTIPRYNCGWKYYLNFWWTQSRSQTKLLTLGSRGKQFKGIVQHFGGCAYLISCQNLVLLNLHKHQSIEMMIIHHFTGGYVPDQLPGNQRTFQEVTAGKYPSVKRFRLNKQDSFVRFRHSGRCCL